MFNLENLVATVLISCFSTLTYGVQKHKVYFKNLEVYSFRHFGSLQTIYFEIPPDSSSFTWDLMINKSLSSCDDETFLLYLQHGSFPIDQHDGENTFPCTYKIGRTGMMKDNMTSTKSLIVKGPLYGQWFLGALIKRSVNQVVKKLSSWWCDYALVGNLTFFVEDIDILMPGKMFKIQESSHSSHLKFMIGRNVYRYTILLEASSTSYFNVSMMTRSGALPAVDSSPDHFFNCKATDLNCSLKFDVFSPEVEKWQYILFHSNDTGHHIPAMDVLVTLHECTTGFLGNQTGSPTCYMTQSLSAITNPDDVHKSIFGFELSEEKFVLIPRPFVSMTTFTIDKFRDVGGTLQVDVTATPINIDFSKGFDIQVCLQRGRPTIAYDGSLSCIDNDTVRLNFSNPNAVIHIPYPEPGLYFIGHQDLNQSRLDDLTHMNISEATLGMFTKVEVTPCEDGKCQNGGTCKETYKGPFSMSFCYCITGSRGFTCADESHRAPSGKQMLYTLLLTLSNLAFIPAIVISFKRWRYVECTIYFFNMISSAFYHVCDMDQWSVYKMCLFSYRLHQFSDFFLSLLSFWVSFLAMSRIRSGFLLPGMILGVVIIAILTASNPVGPATNLIPLISGVLIVAVSWGWRSFRTKALFPSKKEYLWTLPGALLASLGLIIFGFIENDSNYPYTHSLWHLCVASSIPFVIPKTKVVWELIELDDIKVS